MTRQICLLLGFLWYGTAFAQLNPYQQWLRQIEQNNLEIQAKKAVLEQQHQLIRSDNNLPDPVAAFYFLPWGDNNTDLYSEFEISQQFEFPSVYAVRKKTRQQSVVSMELGFEEDRQQILLEAKNLILEFIHLNQMIEVESQRVENAAKLLNNIEQSFEEEAIGIMDVSKARIGLIGERFSLRELENRRSRTLRKLQALNGEKPLNIELSKFPETLSEIELEEIWEEFRLLDPAYRQMEARDQLQSEQLRLARHQGLPDLTAGFNYQGFAGNNNMGVYGGLQIPLWQNRHKVKAAKFAQEAQQIQHQARETEMRSQLEISIENYQMLLEQYNAYKESLAQINSDKILAEAYELGEIGYATYYIEWQFYRQALDRMLELELELHQLQAELFKYKL